MKENFNFIGIFNEITYNLEDTNTNPWLVITYLTIFRK